MEETTRNGFYGRFSLSTKKISDLRPRLLTPFVAENQNPFRGY